MGRILCFNFGCLVGTFILNLIIPEIRLKSDIKYWVEYACNVNALFVPVVANFVPRSDTNVVRKYTFA